MTHFIQDRVADIGGYLEYVEDLIVTPFQHILLS